MLVAPEATVHGACGGADGRAEGAIHRGDVDGHRGCSVGKRASACWVVDANVQTDVLIYDVVAYRDVCVYGRRAFHRNDGRGNFGRVVYGTSEQRLFGTPYVLGYYGTAICGSYTTAAHRGCRFGHLYGAGGATVYTCCSILSERADGQILSFRYAGKHHHRHCQQYRSHGKHLHMLLEPELELRTQDFLLTHPYSRSSRLVVSRTGQQVLRGTPGEVCHR